MLNGVYFRRPNHNIVIIASYVHVLRPDDNHTCDSIVGLRKEGVFFRLPALYSVRSQSCFLYIILPIPNYFFKMYQFKIIWNYGMN